MDPFRKNIFLFIGMTGSDLCLVAAVLSHTHTLYWAKVCGGSARHPWPGLELSVQGIVATVFDWGRKYAAARGLEDSLIKMLGR